MLTSIEGGTLSARLVRSSALARPSCQGPVRVACVALDLVEGSSLAPGDVVPGGVVPGGVAPDGVAADAVAADVPASPAAGPCLDRLP